MLYRIIVTIDTDVVPDSELDQAMEPLLEDATFRLLDGAGYNATVQAEVQERLPHIGNYRE